MMDCITGRTSPVQPNALKCVCVSSWTFRSKQHISAFGEEITNCAAALGALGAQITSELGDVIESERRLRRLITV